MEAAVKAEELRERMIVDRKDFTFETVLSTDRNLLLLQRAKEKGYFIRGIYVLTCNADINVARVNAREALGGHGVPEEKIRSRYDKALALIPKFVEICDILHIYDNTQEPFRSSTRFMRPARSKRRLITKTGPVKSTACVRQKMRCPCA